MNPFRSRPLRTVILTVIGFLATYGAALILAPAWPGFCDGTIVGADCETVGVRTMTGYLLVGLGLATMVFGPIAGSLIHLWIHGARWETPRGSESIITNMPLLIGAIYMASGLLLAATA